jgi:hypothetical protein
MSHKAHYTALGLATLGLLGSSLIATAPAYGDHYRRDYYKEVDGSDCIDNGHHSRECKSKTDLDVHAWDIHGDSGWKVVKLKVDVDFFQKRHEHKRHYDRNRYDDHKRYEDRNRCNDGNRKYDRNKGEYNRRCDDRNKGDYNWKDRRGDKGDYNRKKCNDGNRQYDSSYNQQCKKGGKPKYDPGKPNNGGNPSYEPGKPNNSGNPPYGQPKDNGVTPDTSTQSSPPNGTPNGPDPQGPPQNGPAANTPATDNSATANAAPPNGTPNGPDPQGPPQNGPAANTPATDNSATANAAPANTPAADNQAQCNPNDPQNTSANCKAAGHRSNTAGLTAMGRYGLMRSHHHGYRDDDLGKVKFQYWDERDDEWKTFATRYIDEDGKAEVKIKVKIRHHHELTVRAKYYGVEDEIQGSTSDEETID